MTFGMGKVFLCGGDMSPGPRDDCPDPVHDFPLPSGYSDAHEVAERRLRKRWRNVRCRTCQLYGWEPPAFDTTPRIPHSSKGTT